MPCPIWVTNQDVSGGTYSGVWAVEQVAGKGCFAIGARLPSTTNREISGPAAQAPASRLTMLPRAIQRTMRNILLIVALGMLSISAAAADPLTPQKHSRDTIAGKPLAAQRLGRSHVCAAYGPGFVAVDGTDTCVKVGGSISAEVKSGR
jgi:hypothetical protein